MLLQVGTRMLKQRYDCGCHQITTFPPVFRSLNSPYQPHIEQQFVCHEVWGFGPLWAYFTDNALISGKMSLWQMNLPTVQGTQVFFQRLIW